MLSSAMLRETTKAALVVGLALPACGGDHPAAPGASGAGGSGGKAGAAAQPSSGSAGRLTAGGKATGGAGSPSTASGGQSSGGGGRSAGGAAAGGHDGGAGAAVTAGAGSAIDCREDGDGKTTLVFVNGCARPVSYRGSDLDGGTLAPGAHACVDIGSDTEALSSKRYWGFVGDDPGAERHSLAEFTFNTDFNDFDWYNLSFVDAFNLPLQIVPVARDKCQTLTCEKDLLPACPDVGKYSDASGDVVACVSPDRNDGTSEVALYFEQCDDAYAWSGDDQNGTDPSPVRACAGEDFDIVFCPGGGGT